VNGVSACHCHECGCGHEHDHEEHVDRKGWIRWCGTVLCGVAALLVSHPIASVILWGISYLFVGGHILLAAARDIGKGRPFTENLLMAVASVAAFGIGEHLEAVAVLLFYQVGEMIQGVAVERSRASVKSLLDIRPDRVNIEGRGRLDAASVRKDDVVIVRPGERIPIDGVVISGETTVDMAALTGESMPCHVAAGESVIGGCVNLTGLIRVRASGTMAESTLTKILHVVEESEKRKAKAQNFISRFAAWYTPTVMIVALLVAVIPIFISGFDGAHIYRAAVFLTVSCPCALVISVPIGYFGGIGGASRKGVLFKGANYLEQMGRVETVIMDKTGTLTTGRFAVKTILPCQDEETLLGVCAALEQHSSHPIAQAIKHKNIAYSYAVDQVKEVAGRGVSAFLDGKPAFVGNAAFLQERGITVSKVDTPDAVIHAAWDRIYLGAITVGDTLKESTVPAIRQLRKLGVKRIVMLTGDQEPAARAVAEKLELDGYRCGLLPHEKVAAFEELSQGVTAFVGDGINDAPVLARADVGVAMGGLGSDAAIEAADVVIMDDDPEKLALAIRVSRRTRRLVIGNIVLALGVKFGVLLLGMFGFMWLWLAIVADTGVALLAVLNSLRALRIK
jgi:Cd2+/Zn2+-exporting ATPase